MKIELNPIAYVQSPYKEKFAIPRQPGLVNCAIGQIIFTPEYANPDYVRDIEQFSHLWLIFQFHATTDKAGSPLVRPPRLGGNKKIGVFASRSTFRPNNLGLSKVKLESVDTQNHCLHISGLDLLDKTPIIDIKPYLPYSDSHPDANAGYASVAPEAAMPVHFSPLAKNQLDKLAARYPHLPELITQVLAQDPRPAYQKKVESEREYGVHLYDFNVCWQVNQGQCLVTKIHPR